MRQRSTAIALSAVEEPSQTEDAEMLPNHASKRPVEHLGSSPPRLEALRPERLFLRRREAVDPEM